MKMRKLGPNGPEVSAIGLGCMGMSAFYGGANEAQSISVIHRALDLGDHPVRHGRDVRPHTNEVLVGKALKDRRDQAFIATKFGINYNADRSKLLTDGSPANVRSAIEGSLAASRRRSRRSLLSAPGRSRHADRGDGRGDGGPGQGGQGPLPGPVRGRAGHPAQGPCDPSDHRAADRIFAVEREPEDELFAVVRELGIGFVPYSPLGRGFLSGDITSIDDLEADDFRRTNPRFMGENFQKNLDLVEAVKAIAADKGVTAAQLALAWVLAQGEDLVPIPGTRRIATLEQNAAATDIVLTPEDLARIDAVFPKGAAVGHRYAEAARAALNR
jgi:aryl-alcohol dehydrogenase-like predicted oxidoreductase